MTTLTAAIGAVILSSCGLNAEPDGAGSSPLDRLDSRSAVEDLMAAAASDSTCTEHPGEFEPLRDYVARAHRMVRVLAVSEIGTEEPSDPRRFYEVQVERVEGEKVYAETLQLRSHDQRVRAVQLLAGVPSIDVWAGVGSLVTTSGEPDRMPFAFALNGDEVVFLGECQNELLTEPLRAVHGAKLASVLLQSAELGGSDLALRLGGDAGPVVAAPSERQLIPGLTESEPISRGPMGVADEFEDRTPELGPDYEGLRAVETTVLWPDQLRSSEEVLCLRSEGVWGECVALAAVAPGDDTPTMVVYAPITDTEVELFLLNADTDPNRPKLELARLEVPSAAGYVPGVVFTITDPAVRSSMTAPPAGATTAHLCEVSETERSESSLPVWS